MNRKDFVKRVFGSLLALPFIPKLTKASKKYDVQTFEHCGWGVEGGEWGESKYVTRWTFESKEEAVSFVRSLIPRLRKITLSEHHTDKTNSIRSGYRDAVRAIFPEGIVGMEVEIVSQKEDLSVEPVNLNIPAFWSIGTAWGYLANIRVNGEPVSRPNKVGKISQYLVEPFIYDRKNSAVEYI